MCLILCLFFKSQISNKWFSRNRWDWRGHNWRLKYLRPQGLLSYSPSGRVIFEAKKKKCQLAISRTLCLMPSPPNNYFQTLTYGTMNWNKSTALKCTCLPKLAKVKSRYIILKSSSEIVPLKCKESSIKKTTPTTVSDCTDVDKLYCSVQACLAKHCDYVLNEGITMCLEIKYYNISVRQHNLIN